MARKKQKTQETFPEFRNLIFFNGRHKNTYFYFYTLLRSYEKDKNPPSPAYIKKAKEIGEKGQAYLSKIPNVDTEDGKSIYTEQYKQIINILNQAIAQERRNENLFIRNKMYLLAQNFPKEKNKEIELLKKYLLDLQNGNSISDAAFILIVNIAQQGLKNTNAITAFELQHLEDLQAAQEQANTALVHTIEGLAKTKRKDEIETERMIEAALGKRDNLRIQGYLKEHDIKQVRGYKKYVKNMQTSSDKIAAWLEKEVQKQLTEHSEEYAALVNTKGKKNKQQLIKERLIRALLRKVPDILPEILNGMAENFDYEQFTQDLFEDVEMNIDIDIIGLPADLGIRKKHLKYFNDRITKNNAAIQSSEGLYVAFIEVIKKLKEKNKKLKKIKTSEIDEELLAMYDESIKDIQTLLKKVSALSRKYKPDEYDITFSTEGKRKKDRKLIVTISTKKGEVVEVRNLGEEFEQAELDIYTGLPPSRLKTISFSSIISTIKRGAGRKIRDNFNSLILSKKNATLRKGVQDAIEEQLANIRVSITGHEIEEVLQGVEWSLTKRIYTGKKNVKNDFIEIVIAPPTSFKQLPSMLQSILDGTLSGKKTYGPIADAIHTYNENLKRMIKSNINIVDKKKAFTDYNLMAKQYFKTQILRQNTLKKLKKIFDQIEATIKIAAVTAEEKTKALKDLAKIRKAVLESIQNTVDESSTIQTFATYQNDIGAIGGDLGPNVMAQLDSFNQLFTAAGIPIPKETLNWLFAAIINNSPYSVVKKNNEDFIERYLGGLAVFSLFNEGGAELSMLKDQLEKTKEEGRTIDPNNHIMHLYKINGVYYPGSYVLKTVLEKMVPFMEEINRAEKNLSSKNIAIYNYNNMTILPNQGVQEPVDIQPWETVRDKFSEDTKIKVLFLAGLLDVIKELREEINGIELPE